MTAPAAPAPAVEGGGGGLYRRNWDTDKTWTPPVQRPPLVPARTATPEETPSTVGALARYLEGLGYTTHTTYAQGYPLGKDTPVETVALRVDREGKRVAWATWLLGEPTKKGGRSGKGDTAWARDSTVAIGWRTMGTKEWKAYLTEQANG